MIEFAHFLRKYSNKTRPSFGKIYLVKTKGTMWFGKTAQSRVKMEEKDYEEKDYLIFENE